MVTDVILPKIGFSMNEGEIAEWLVPNGGQAVEGHPLYSLEADKSTNEVDSPASGTLTILVGVGETCEVGTVIATID